LIGELESLPEVRPVEKGVDLGFQLVSVLPRNDVLKSLESSHDHGHRCNRRAVVEFAISFDKRERIGCTVAEIAVCHAKSHHNSCSTSHPPRHSGT
jgi:hypothetical protein